MTGGQAVQMVKAGLKAIYLSGWQVAADANLAGQTYPDQSLYPANSVPALVRRLNNALLRADQIDRAEGSDGTHWLAPIVADAEAGFGGPLNAFELMKAMIEAGAAGVHFEDQLSSEKKCGHLGGKVLVPTAQHVRTLVAARLAADVLRRADRRWSRAPTRSRPTLLTSDVDEPTREFLTGERTPEGFFRVRDGLEPAIARALAYAPYCRPALVRDLDAGPRRGARVRRRRCTSGSPASCSPTTARRRSTGASTSTTPRSPSFRETLAELGYRYQFITLAGFHSLNAGMFELARGYAADGMPAYVELQEREFALEAARLHGDPPPARGRRRLLRRVIEAVSGGQSSTLALRARPKKRSCTPTEEVDTMSTVELTRETDGPGLLAALAEHGLEGELVEDDDHLTVAGRGLRRGAAGPRDRGLDRRARPAARPGAPRRLHVHGLAAGGLESYTERHGPGRHQGRRPRARARGGDRLGRDRAGDGAAPGAALRAVRGQPHAGARGAAEARRARARLVRAEPRRARADAVARGAAGGVPRPRRAGEPGDRARDAEDHDGGARRARRGRAALQRADARAATAAPRGRRRTARSSRAGCTRTTRSTT